MISSFFKLQHIFKMQSIYETTITSDIFQKQHLSKWGNLCLGCIRLCFLLPQW